MELAVTLLSATDSNGFIVKNRRDWVRECLSNPASKLQLNTELHQLLHKKITFEDIPEKARNYLSWFIEREARFRGLWTKNYFIKNRIQRSARKVGMLKSGSTLTRLFWGGDQKLFLTALYGLRSKLFGTQHMRIEDVFEQLEFDPLLLMGTFITPVKIAPQQAGCRQDGEVTTAYLLGLDIISSGENRYILEANVSPGVNENRKAVYEADPIAAEMINMASELRAETLILDWAWHMPVNPWFHAQLISHATNAGITVHLSLDPRIAAESPYPQSTAKLPHELAKGRTLVIKTKNNQSGQDFFVSNKEVLNATLLNHKASFPDAQYDVAQMLSEPKQSWIEEAQPDLPNLVYKYINENRGVGVHFMKAKSVEHALTLADDIDRETGLPRGMFQQFTCSNLLEGRHFYDIRSFILLSPTAVRFAGCLRRVSAHSLPKVENYGRVKDNNRFLSNVSRGNAFSACPPDEISRVKDTSMEVAEVLKCVLSSNFDAAPIKSV